MVAETETLDALVVGAGGAVERGIKTVLWCTGFKGDFSWVRLPGVLDGRGQPVHDEGVAPAPGIYFAGLDLSSTRKSGTLLALEEDARRIVERITARTP